MTLPARDDDGFGWPPGHLDALEQRLDEQRRIGAEAAHRELLREIQRAAERRAIESVAEPARATPEPAVVHEPDQQERPEPQSDLDHARTILARDADISERDLAGALTVATGRKIGRRVANRLAAEVRASGNLRVVTA